MNSTGHTSERLLTRKGRMMGVRSRWRHWCQAEKKTPMVKAAQALAIVL
jgi:hypothetical protein